MEIKELLVEDNPWWTRDKERIDTPEFKRSIVDKIADNNRLSTILFGPRQAGKTTIFEQVINKKLEMGDRKILYAPMDRFPDISLVDLIREYQEITGYTSGTYFFDEIHNVENWAVELKSLVDSRKDDDFYATGSSPIVLVGRSAESGIGRFDYHPVSPFSFGEYCFYNNKGIKLPELFKLRDEKESRLITFHKDIMPLLSKYLIWGGFPSQFNLDYKLEDWQNYLRQNYVSLTIYKDVLSYFEVREPSILEDILFLISEKTGLPLSYTSISKSFNISIESIRNYIRYLEASGLVIICEFYSDNVLKRKRRNKKFYIIDPGLNSALRYKKLLDDRFTSLNIELTVANYLKNYLRKKTGLLDPKLNYWKDKYEVDFVVNIEDKTVPLEVKYKNVIDDRDLKGILSFMDEYEVEGGIVVTKNTYEQRDIDEMRLYLIPSTLFLNVQR